MATIDVKDAGDNTVAIEKPLTPGRAAATASRPVVLSTEDKTALDALATQTTAAAILAKLIASPATEATLAALLAKVIAAPSTEAKQDSAISLLAAIGSLLTTQAGYLDGIEGNQTTGNSSLSTIAGKDFATQTTLAAVLAKIIAAPATEAKQDTGNTSLASIDTKLSTQAGYLDGVETALAALGTQTTLAAILAKIIAAPATEAKQDSAITQETAINTVLGVKGDAKSTATDTTAISAVSIWKQISASVQLMVFGAGTAAAAQRTTLASDDPAVATLGAVADAAVTAGATGSISAKLRSISRDIVSNIVLAAGTAIIGKVGIDQTTAGTTNGVVENASSATGGIATTARLASAAASTNATNVKTSAGRVYSAQGYNAAAYPVYLVLYDSATNPPVPGTTTIRKKIPIPAGAAFALDWPVGMSFANGIGYAFTKLAADADTTVLVAADVLQFNLDYV